MRKLMIAPTWAEKMVVCVCSSVIILSSALCSCSGEDPEPEGANISILVNTDSLEDVVISFAPCLFDIEPMGARTRGAIADAASRLDIWLIEGTDTIARHQTKTDEDFGTVALTLDRTKTYRLIALAHKAAGECVLRDVITFPDDAPKECFFYATTFSPADTQSLACELRRVCGKFTVATTDQVPESVKSVSLTVMDTSTTLNADGTPATMTADRTVEFASISRRADGSASFSCYILATDAEQRVTVTVTARDADGGIVEQRTFADLPIRANYKTSVSGAFFTSQGMSLTMTVGDQWNEYDTIGY